MLKYLKIFIITVFLLNFISCTNKDQESLLLDSEGGNIDQNDTLTEEIEIIDNTAQIIEMDEVELTVEEKLSAELIEVGDRIFFGYDESTISDESAEILQQQYQFLISLIDLNVNVINLIHVNRNLQSPSSVPISTASISISIFNPSLIVFNFSLINLNLNV